MPFPAIGGFLLYVRAGNGCWQRAWAKHIPVWPEAQRNRVAAAIAIRARRACPIADIAAPAIAHLPGLLRWSDNSEIQQSPAPPLPCENRHSPGRNVLRDNCCPFQLLSGTGGRRRHSDGDKSTSTPTCRSRRRREGRVPVPCAWQQ